MDVSGHQGNVDWKHWWGQGMRFAYVKATEGTGYRSPYFAQQYNGSYRIGMIRGAYHFALPNRSSGREQARYFLAHGGGWSADGKTLPGALDIEYNPYGPTCYGLSASAMVGWIRDFSNTYHAKTGRYPTIYSTTDWWVTCTGNNGGFGQTNGLWLARYSSSPGTLPRGWRFHTFWQYSSNPIDQNWFNGSYQRLKVYARGAEDPAPTTTAPPPPPPPPPPPTTSEPPPPPPTTTAPPPPTTTAPPPPTTSEPPPPPPTTSDPPPPSPTKSKSPRPTKTTSPPSTSKPPPAPTSPPAPTEPPTNTGEPPGSPIDSPEPSATGDTPAPPPTDPGNDLPVTGSGLKTTMMAGLGTVLLGGGIVMLVLGWRRREETA